MTNIHPQELGLLGRLVVAIGILLFVTGVMWHGVTAGTFPRIWDGLIGRLGGPMKFRFIYFAAVDGGDRRDP